MKRKSISIPSDLYEAVGFIAQAKESTEAAIERLLIEAVHCKASLYTAKAGVATALLNRYSKSNTAETEQIPEELIEVSGTHHRAQFDKRKGATDEG